MPFDDIDDLAFDVRQALLDQGGPEMSSPDGCEAELFEFVGVDTGTGSHANDLVEHVNRGNRNDTSLRFPKRGIGIVPWPGGYGKLRFKVNDHGPRDRHDVVFLAIIRRNEDNRAWFQQCERFVDRHAFHVSQAPILFD